MSKSLKPITHLIVATLVFTVIAGLVQMEVDLAKIKAARPAIATVLREHQEKK